ncbi:MAG: methyltransferase domain-containing protein [Nakamurella sp.]
MSGEPLEALGPVLLPEHRRPPSVSGVQCHYFDSGACRSCRLMGVPYRRQVADKQAAAEQTLREVMPGVQWLEPFAGPESGYRNKAKWVVGGSSDSPTIGILDEFREGIDLRECGICEPALVEAFPVLAAFISSCGLVPYDVRRRTGEIKYLIVTASPEGELMVRFVLRSRVQLPAIRRGLPELLAVLPQAAVVSVNLHPEHKAVLEGHEEVVLTDRRTLPMRLHDVTLHLGPQGFFQTNSTVASALYRQATEWATDVQPSSVLDMYCGVGGFALFAAPASARSIRGVELSEDAVAAARASALQASGPERFTFGAGDAAMDPAPDADLVIVNPPRRGIGEGLAHRLETSPSEHVLYSSCNPVTLAQDLARMPSLRPRQARLFDMFPQTAHVEVAVLLDRV